MARRHLSDIVGHLFPTTQVGSYPRPSWNRHDLNDTDFAVAMRDAAFAEAFLDGTGAMIRDQVEVGIDVPTDGHLWYDRQQGFITSFLMYPAQRIKGLEVRPEMNPIMLQALQMSPAWEGTVAAFGGAWGKAAVTGPIARGTMRLAQLWEAAQSVSDRPVKCVSGMGPMNIAAWLSDEYYNDPERLWNDLATVYNQELLDCAKAGARIIQLDDCAFALMPPELYPKVVEMLNKTLEGVDAYKVFHICHLGAPVPVGQTPYPAFFELVATQLNVDALEFAYAETNFPDEHLRLWQEYPNDKDMGLGVINIKNMLVETPDEVAAGVRKALQYVEPERIYLTTDCGLYAYSRVLAKAKLRAMARGAALMREEIGAKRPASATV